MYFSLSGVRVPGQIAQQFQAEAPLTAQLKKQKKKVQETVKEVKFINSEKAIKFCEIFTLFLTTVHTVKSKVKISQNFVAFSEYMNFNFL